MARETKVTEEKLQALVKNWNNIFKSLFALAVNCLSK